MRSIFDISIITILVIGLSACSSMQQAYSPLPPVKVITESVELEIYQPPLPQAISKREIFVNGCVKNSIEKKTSRIYFLYNGKICWLRL